MSTPPPSIPSAIPPPPIENTFGALLLGTFFACILYGLTTHQTYRYFRLYHGDAWCYKLLRRNLREYINIITSYFYLVLSYFNPTQLENGTWSLRTSIGLTVYILSERTIGYAIAALLPLLGRVDVGTFRCRRFSIRDIFIISRFIDFVPYFGLTLAALLINFVSDIIISGSIAFLLRLRRTGNNGVVTLASIIAALSDHYPELICMPDNLVYLGIELLLSKLYANSMLAVLNSRYSLRDRGAEGLEIGALDLQTPGYGQQAQSAWGLPPPRDRRDGGSRFIPPVINIGAL
ncbi:hypothetical protein BD779DRAFT_1474379 [Infundibulicybe gibba]|nr:hypothetical protein BD779DRAFT_1474379 [Infundibulicybe gibba]